MSVLDTFPGDQTQERKTVVLVHGIPGQATNFDSLITKLHDMDIRAIAPSDIGSQLSPYNLTLMPNIDFTTSGRAHRLRTVLKELNILRIDLLIGHSAGAWVVYEAIAGGLRVGSLFLFSPNGAEPNRPPYLVIINHCLIWFAFFPLIEAYVIERISSILDSQSSKGGVSPHLGGRDERPPTLKSGSGVTASSANNRWVPPSSAPRDGVKPKDKNDQIFRRVRGILNKLTPEKFDKLSLELLNVGIETQVILKGIILLIFEKALEEPKYSSLYAQLCHRLCEDSPNFDPQTSSVTTFRRLLLNKCQDEFENRSHATEVFDKKDVRLTEEECEQYHIVKKKMLGNLKFIGELGKLQMLHEGILHKCIKQLLEKKKNAQLRDMSEDLECLCQIMRTIGPRIDTPKARAWMDQYFERINQFALNSELPSRIRFMLQDVIELRDNDWKPRKIANETGPKTITQIRQEAGVNGRGSQNNQSLLQSRMMNMGNIPGTNWKGGMGDIFSMPVGSMSNAIGVGPGVIQMDNFSSMPNNFNNGMNRNRFNQQNPSYQNNFQTNFNNKGRGKSQQEGSGSSPNNQRRNNQGAYNQQGGNTSGHGGGGSYGQQGGGYGQQNFQPSHHFQQQQNKQGGMNRDLPPRFQRMVQQQTGPGAGQGGRESGMGPNNSGSAPIGAPGQPSPSTSPPLNLAPPVNGIKEEVSLRPVKNFTMFKPNTPSMLPRSAQAQHPAPRESGFVAKKSTDISEMLNPLLDKQQQQQQQQQQQPTAVKQIRDEKNKSPVKEKLTKEKMIDRLSYLLSECYVSHSLADTVADIKEMNVPRKMIPDLLAQIMLESLEKTDAEQELSMKLIDDLRSDGVTSADQFMQGFKQVCNQMSELETDVPLVKSHVARFGAMALTLGLVSLTELAEPLENGVHYPLFLLCLQHTHKIKDKQWLVDIFNQSKLDLQSMLPELDQNKERMLEILEDRGLSFMFPLLRIQSELGRQIAAEPTATAVFKWVKDKVDTSLHTDPGFINVLVTAVLKFITSESTMKDEVDITVTPEKALMDKEKELLEKLKGVLQLFLHDHTNLQMAALYAVQVFCYTNQFPKGMFLRFFVNLYDMEVIEEEVYLRWKEEVNDQYPGKGKALFQVNQWLNWLEQAEEDDSEEEDE
ncbi:eukaryotic translation initiation factor 4 gamma 2 [Aplysia californica]|uniref:Eukaryotic translation initiation factor 4 gamma 2 n=1 Tax=Aplysia californica TaxID=6500 RepID=A0ABM1AAL9_APLCA|nr:eukaryotic translation initiation factor 4 gamma 2 [Aplysia californica]